jgi:hypothetical protein
MSPLLISHPLLPNPKEHIYSVENYPLIMITTFVMSPKCNVNVTIEGSCNIQEFLIFAPYFTNFLHLNNNILTNTNPS